MRGKEVTTIAIMQPTYLPWLGYFNLIDQADIFVFLDSVPFEKQSWQQRNQIRTPKGLEWITVPVLIKKRFGQLISEVDINPVRFPNQHIKQIRQNYSRAPHFRSYEEEFFEVLKQASEGFSLNSLSITLIKWICSKLSLTTRFVRSSELSATGKRSELLVNISKELDAAIYLSPLGSLDYIKNEYHYFEEAKIDVLFNQYVHPEYNQTYTPFLPYASVIDLLFNEGPESASIIRSGQQTSIHAKELID